MKTASALLLLALAAPAAFAVKLINRDSNSHDLVVKCSSSAQTSIGASSTRDIGNGPCTVTVKKTGSSATASGSQSLTIKDGKVSVTK
jgi:predicted porin